MASNSFGGIESVPGAERANYCAARSGLTFVNLAPYKVTYPRCSVYSRAKCETNRPPSAKGTHCQEYSPHPNSLIRRTAD